MSGAVRRRLAITLGAVLLAGCAGTVYDASEVRPTSVDTTTTTTLPSGTVDELLPRLVDEAASLSGVMDTGGDRVAVGERLQALWNVIRPQMDAVRPDDVGPFEAALALSMRAVNLGRRADADKAAKNLDILTRTYLRAG